MTTQDDDTLEPRRAEDASVPASAEEAQAEPAGTPVPGLPTTLKDAIEGLRPSISSEDDPVHGNHPTGRHWLPPSERRLSSRPPDLRPADEPSTPAPSSYRPPSPPPSPPATPRVEPASPKTPSGDAQAPPGPSPAPFLTRPSIPAAFIRPQPPRRPAAEPAGEAQPASESETVRESQAATSHRTDPAPAVPSQDPSASEERPPAPAADDAPAEPPPGVLEGSARDMRLQALALLRALDKEK